MAVVGGTAVVEGGAPVVVGGAVVVLGVSPALAGNRNSRLPGRRELAGAPLGSSARIRRQHEFPTPLEGWLRPQIDPRSIPP